MDYDLTRKVLAALEHGGVRDLDIFIAPEPDNIERLKTALRSVFDDPCIDDITATDLLGEYPAVQYVPPSGNFHIDILTRLGELFDFASLESERVDFDGVSVPTVTPETLYRMKKGTVRPKDWGDAQRIALRFGLKE
jgi:hypothetical protein